MLITVYAHLYQCRSTLILVQLIYYLLLVLRIRIRKNSKECKHCYKYIKISIEISVLAIYFSIERTLKKIYM